MNDAQLEREVSGSRARLGEELGVPCESFCYPNGDWDDRVVRSVRLAGYRRAVTTAWGPNGPPADPFLLSKGGRQCVAVASVLATRPEVLILDEPTTGLDHGEVDEMMALVRRLNEAGHTVVMITHAMRVAAEHARRVVALAGGKIVADGPPEEIFHGPELLAAAALKPPAAAALAGRLGLSAVSVEGILAALERA